MIENITSAVTGLISALTSLLDPTVPASSSDVQATPYIALLALPVLAGSIAFARRLIKKAR